MPKRKPLSKKIRFEVFKRDMFTCQYCGAKAPDVLLEVDHIVPVKEGGSDDILNLITSCRNCNRGKSSVKLSDNTVIQKKQKQAEELQERREQLELMYEWHKQLLEETEIEVKLKSIYCLKSLNISIEIRCKIIFQKTVFMFFFISHRVLQCIYIFSLFDNTLLFSPLCVTLFLISPLLITQRRKCLCLRAF